MAIKPRPRAKVKPRTTLRQIEARSKASNRMKGKHTANKFNANAMENIRQKGFADGFDAFQPDAGIDKKTGMGTMYTAGQYAKVKAFNDRIAQKNRANRMDGMKKGVVIGGAVGGSAVAAGSYWSQKKNNDRNSK